MVRTFFIQLCILSFIISYTEVAGHGGVIHKDCERLWNYKHDCGPKRWIKYFPQCNGTRQSPIDIETAKAEYDENLGNIAFNNYEKPTNVNFTARNTGRTFLVEFEGYTNETVPWISGGGLPGNFKLVHFNFHWGKNNTRGSEHQLNNKTHACELEMVHINTKYATVSDAENKLDGLAVLSIFVDVGEKNEVFENFLNLSMYNVTLPGNATQVKPFDLMSLLPSNKNFYRYNGSLTTPSCPENVTWTVFAQAIVVSDEQLNEFRKMRYMDGGLQSLLDIYRPVRPLNGRVVKVNFGPLITPSSTVRQTSQNATSSSTPRPTSQNVTSSSTPMPSPTKKSDSNGIHGNIMLIITSLFLVVIPFLKNEKF